MSDRPRAKCITLDIECHDAASCQSGPEFVQARYLVHGYDDSLWTDDLDAAMAYLRASLEQLSKRGA